MKDAYVDIEHWASAMLWKVDFPLPEVGLAPPYYILSRIEVNQAFRHQGYASSLLRKVCDDADEEQVTLALIIEPDGTLYSRSYHELYEWYYRYGFRPMPLVGFMKRVPEA
jgi:ribosomal protein S18 acetylase RimI-like enzyme